MQITLLTVCSNRKAKTLERVRASDLPRGSQTELGTRWSQWIANARVELVAEELYQGRGFGEAKKTARRHSCDLWIISAGLGLIPANRPVPGYDLTIASGSTNSISDRLEQGRFDANAWWRILAGHTWPIREMVRSQTDRLIVISLPSTYLPLIEQDLAGLTPTELDRLRLLGPRPANVPRNLRSIHMPYDSRFDGQGSPIPGTRSDFAQRTTRHFIDTVVSEHPFASPREHITAVNDALHHLRAPGRKFGKRYTDLEIKTFINDQWNNCQGRSGKMLRLFRERLDIACEQSRFKRLFHEVKSNRTQP